MRLAPRVGLAVAALAVTCAGCTSGSGPAAPTTPTAATPSSSPAATASAAAAPAPQAPTATSSPVLHAAPARAARATTPAATTPTKVLVVVEENEDRGPALRAMPDLAALGAKYEQVTHYTATTHPSLPNYLAIAGGTTFGIRDDELPAAHHLAGPSVFDRALAAHRTAKAYAEGMPVPCDRTSTSVYAPRHNPWVYFASATSRRNCLRHDVPFGTFTAGAFHHDVLAGTLPDVGMVTPDLCDDAHDCGLSTADRWLRRLMDLVERGPDFRTGRLAVVVTFDEGSYSGPNTVATVVVAQELSHRTVSTALDHYSLSRLLSQVGGSTPLHLAATAPSMMGVLRR